MSIERNAFDAPELGVELASALHKLYPEQFHMERMIDLLANQSVYDAIAKGEDPRRIAEDWREPLEKFQRASAEVSDLQIIAHSGSAELHSATRTGASGLQLLRERCRSRCVQPLDWLEWVRLICAQRPGEVHFDACCQFQDSDHQYFLPLCRS